MVIVENFLNADKKKEKNKPLTIIPATVYVYIRTDVHTYPWRVVPFLYAYKYYI